MFQATINQWALVFFLLYCPNTYAQKTSQNLSNKSKVALTVKPIAQLAITQKKPKLQLARNYQNHINIQNYWISEKLDGVRGHWNGKKTSNSQW